MSKKKKDRAADEDQIHDAGTALQTGKDAEKPEKPIKEKPAKKQQGKDQPVDIGINLFKGIFYLFLFLIAFFLWTAWSSLTSGNFSLLALLFLALAGFLCAFLSKKLEQSGYFNLYRILSILMFIPVLVTQFFRSEMDGFTFGLLGIFSGCVLLTAVLPYFFEGISIEKLVTISIGALFVFAYSFIMLANSTLIPSEKTLSFGNAYPPGMIFEKSGKNVWIFGDNRFLKGKTDPVSFIVFEEMHPDKAIAKGRADRLAAQNHQDDKNKKKNGATPTPTPSTSPTPAIVWTESPSALSSGTPDAAASASPSASPTDTAAAASPSPAVSGTPAAPAVGTAAAPPNAFVQKGENFSASPDKQGNLLAVTGEKIDGGNTNEVFVVNLENHTKTVLFKDSVIRPFIPTISATYPGYSVWNAAGTKFFFFGKGSDDKVSLYIADAVKNESRRIEAENALSACWTGPDDLRIITGEKTAPKDVYLENRFCFEIKNGIIHKLAADSAAPEKVLDVNPDTARIAIHPTTGNIITFNGKDFSLLSAGSTAFSASPFTVIPTETACIISDDGKLLAYSLNGKTSYLNLETGAVKDVEQSSDRIANLTFTGDSRYLLYFASSTDSMISLFQIHTLVKIFDLKTGILHNLTPNYLTGNIKTGREFIPASPWQAFFWNPDPNTPEVFYDALHSGKNGVKSVGIWKLSSLYGK